MNKNELWWLKWELRKYLNLLKEELKNLSDDKISKINNEISGISNFYTNIFEWESWLEKQINNLISKLENYEVKYNAINSYHSQLLEWNEEEISIKEYIETVLEEIKNYKTDLLDWVNWNKSIKDKINTSFVKIKEYYDFIYWIEEEKNENWDITKEWQKWYKEKLDKLYSDKNKEYWELKNQIEWLLPGATSAWLSSAYKEMKDSFNLSNIFWNLMFFLTLWIAIYLWKDIKVWENLEKTILNIISHLPFILPLIWLAFFSSKQQSQNKRLQQEYAHKESLAKSFEWYKKQIDGLWEDDKSTEIKKMLMENIVKMTWENPSNTLDKNHWTNPPVWEYLFWSKEKK